MTVLIEQYWYWYCAWYGTIVMYCTNTVSKLPYVWYCMKKYDTGTYLYENKRNTVVFQFEFKRNNHALQYNLNNRPRIITLEREF